MPATRPQPPLARPLTGLALFALGILVGAIGARTFGAPRIVSSGATDARVEDAPAAAPRADATSPDEAPAVSAPVSSRSIASSVVVGDAGRPVVDTQRPVRQAVGALLGTFRSADRFRGDDGAPLEARVNEQMLYLGGWLDAVHAQHGGDFSVLAPAVDEQLCAPESSDVDVAAMLAVAVRARGSVTTRGLDCALSRSSGEDQLLWWTLDAWSRSDLPTTPEYERRRETSSDPRTLRRFEGPRMAR